MSTAQLIPRRRPSTPSTLRRSPTADRILREAAFVLHLARKVRDDIVGGTGPVTSR